MSAAYFDLLHADGQDLIDLPAHERFAALSELVPDSERMPRIVTADPDEARAFSSSRCVPVTNG